MESTTSNASISSFSSTASSISDIVNLADLHGMIPELWFDSQQGAYRSNTSTVELCKLAAQALALAQTLLKEPQDFTFHNVNIMKLMLMMLAHAPNTFGQRYVASSIVACKCLRTVHYTKAMEGAVEMMAVGTAWLTQLIFPCELNLNHSHLCGSTVLLNMYSSKPTVKAHKYITGEALPLNSIATPTHRQTAVLLPEPVVERPDGFKDKVGFFTFIILSTSEIHSSILASSEG